MEADSVLLDPQKMWDQRASLQPPPYQGAMRPMLEGISRGDELVDELPDAVISPCVGHKNPRLISDIPQLPEPSWVNWELVQHGQELWKQHLGRAFMGLTAALLQGFTIARFAEVLNHAGYAQSPYTSLKRYSSTAYHISDWFRYPLNDPQSIARQSIYKVRCMHGFARRRSKGLFSQERGEGIALSQYDLGEVQLGFSAVCLSIMEVEMGMQPFTAAELEAMVHTWRIIGWHLGIEDQFNVCRSPEHLAQCLEDYMVWTPQRLRTCRESTHILQLAAVSGFGKHLGLGIHYFKGFIAALQNMRGIQVRYSNIEALPGMDAFVRFRFTILGKSDNINWLVGRFIFSVRDLARNRPWLTEQYQRNWAPGIAAFHDSIIWQVVSLFARLRLAFQQPRVRAAVVFLLLAVAFRLRISRRRLIR